MQLLSLVFTMFRGENECNFYLLYLQCSVEKMNATLISCLYNFCEKMKATFIFRINTVHEK